MRRRNAEIVNSESIKQQSDPRGIPEYGNSQENKKTNVGKIKLPQTTREYNIIITQVLIFAMSRGYCCLRLILCLVILSTFNYKQIAPVELWKRYRLKQICSHRIKTWKRSAQLFQVPNQAKDNRKQVQNLNIVLNNKITGYFWNWIDGKDRAWHSQSKSWHLS